MQKKKLKKWKRKVRMEKIRQKETAKRRKGRKNKLMN